SAGDQRLLRADRVVGGADRRPGRHRVSRHPGRPVGYPVGHAPGIDRRPEWPVAVRKAAGPPACRAARCPSRQVIAMIYRVAADGLLLLHLAFVLFALLGGLLCLWRPSMMLWHLPAAAWAIVVEI